MEIQKYYKVETTGGFTYYNTTPPSWRHPIEITKEEYDQAVFILKVKGLADKGQEVENAIELNNLVRGFLERKERTYLNFMLNHLRHNNDAGFDGMVIKRNEVISKLGQVERFEADIAIATNLDPNHPINSLEENDFIEVLRDIKTGDAWRWNNITKILKVEIAYEPEQVAKEYEKIQKAIHDQLHATDPTQAVVNAVVDGGIT